MALVMLAVIAAVTAFLSIRELSTSAGRVLDRGTGAVERIAGVIAGVWNVQPEIIYDDSVIVEKGHGASKLIVVEHPVEVRREMSHEFLRSTKRLRVEGRFIAMAGFDLEKPFEVQLDGESLSVIVPPPEIIAIESEKLEISEMRDGLWNKLTPAEVELAMNELPDLAREKVANLAVLDEVITSFEQQLQQRLGDDWNVRVRTVVATPQAVAD